MAINEAETNALVDGFSRAAFRGNGVWFLGAGVGRPAGLAGWDTLLAPLALELGLKLDPNDDLPAVAQYYINKNSGNRGPLIQHLRETLNRIPEPSIYHREVARSSVATIWTTNYDGLMERALQDLSPRVRVRESDMVEFADAAGVEVIKAHGSFGVSKPAEFVIASQDYEDYAVLRPAMVQRLRQDLLTKSFLFVGYGYGDPNVQTALVEARRLAQQSTLPHWMLQVEIKGEKQRAQRQQLWVEDLARIGIRCVLVDDYDKVVEIVARVARRSRGPTAYVTGSHDNKSDPIAVRIGELFAGAPAPIMLDGQSEGVSRSLLSAFQASCVAGRVDLNERLRFFPNPYASNAKLSNDPSLLPVLRSWRGKMLRRAHSVIAFDGGMGTKAEVEIAQALGCRIIPVTRNPAGSALELLAQREIADDLELRNPGYVAKAKTMSLTAQDVVDCVLADMPT